LLLDLPRDQRVGRLQRLDRSDLLDLPQLVNAEVGDTDMADEAISLELGERRPALLDLLGRDRPVDLIQIHRIHPEPRKAPFQLTPQRVTPQALNRRAPRPLGLSTLREHERALAETGQRAAHHLLGVPETVLRSRVDPVHTQLKRVMNRRHRLVILLGTPPPVIAGTPDRPGAEPHAGDLKPGLAELRR